MSYSNDCVLMGFDEHECLTLFFDSGFDGVNFYKEFYFRLKDSNYNKFLLKNNNDYWIKTYNKDSNYTLENCIKNYINTVIIHWDKIYFPMYIVRKQDGWWYIIENDEFLLKRTIKFEIED